MKKVKDAGTQKSADFKKLLLLLGAPFVVLFMLVIWGGSQDWVPTAGLIIMMIYLWIIGLVAIKIALVEFYKRGKHIWSRMRNFKIVVYKISK